MSTITNPRSETIEIQNSKPSGSNFIGVHASNTEKSDSENEVHPLRVSGSKDLKYPAKPLYCDEIDLDATMISKENSEEKDSHMVTGANRKLDRQNTQNAQSLNDTTGSHANHNTSSLTAKSVDPGNHIAVALEELANKNSQSSLFHPKHTLTFNGKNEKAINSSTAKTYFTQLFEYNRT